MRRNLKSSTCLHVDNVSNPVYYCIGISSSSHPIAMPDHPEDFPPDLNLSMFEGRNFSRGLYSVFINPEDENGIPKLDREDAQKFAEASKNIDELIERACEATFQESLDDLQELRDEMQASSRNSKAGAEVQSNGKPNSSKPSAPGRRAVATITSKSAAVALSSAGKPNSRLLASTVDANRGIQNARSSGKHTAVAPSKTNARIHAVATAAAKSTLGYSNGRAVSTSVRPALSSVSQGSSHPRSASTMSTKCPNIAPKRAVTTSAKAGTLRPLSGASRPQPRSNGKENKENHVKTSYQEETDLIKKLQMQSLETDDDLNSSEDLMGAFSSDRLLLGEDAFEEFRFEIPDL
jgi:hypothetical protein